MSRYVALFLMLALIVLPGCGANGSADADEAAERNQKIENATGDVSATTKESSRTMTEDGKQLEIATFGAGCYWCIEAVLQQVEGVKKLESGFMGGHIDNPTYEEVCAETTGHAEVVQVTFDPSVLEYRELLGWFWKLHDPTTLNRQGNDVGTQYRSAIFYHSDAQKEIAEDSKVKVGLSGAFQNPIVTEISEATTFWKARADHQDYYRRNKTKNPYCSYVITPKLKKLGLDY